MPARPARGPSLRRVRAWAPSAGSRGSRGSSLPPARIMGTSAVHCRDRSAPGPSALSTGTLRLRASSPAPGPSGPAGARKDWTASSPGCSGGSSRYVEPTQFFGVWQTRLHVGFGHAVGALQFHLHWGCSQTFLHGCAWGHWSMHIGSEHFVTHCEQPSAVHSRGGHTTEQCGLPHFILHPLMSVAEHRVWQVGLLHSGLHSSSQTGFVQL
mmetsp:Transcript_110946/g.313862  ORF Transcript_110946/g.313862 Transcript_110946/m.313862 type:complete len:211 (-) Transcript_110946:1673-2305(-)